MEARRSGDLGAAARAFALPAEALRLLVREPLIRRMAVVPLALSIVALAVAIAMIVSFAGEALAFASALFPSIEAGAWYTWLWVGPVTGALWLAEKLLVVFAAVALVVAALLVASVAAAPFHDALSRRVEEHATGTIEETQAEGFLAVLREGGRAVRQEVSRLLLFVSVWAAVLVFGIVVPGGQLVAPALLAVATVFFLSLDYASYTLDRRRLSFAEKRRWVRENLGAALGFGAAAFLLCAVPVVNALAMPVLVVAGTLLALRHPARSGAPATRDPDAGRGTATSP